MTGQDWGAANVSGGVMWNSQWFPAAGNRWDNGPWGAGSDGYYWAANPYGPTIPAYFLSAYFTAYRMDPGTNYFKAAFYHSARCIPE